jgi:hypothetical protein
MFYFIHLVLSLLCPVKIALKFYCFVGHVAKSFGLKEAPKQLAAVN